MSVVRETAPSPTSRDDRARSLWEGVRHGTRWLARSTQGHSAGSARGLGRLRSEHVGDRLSGPTGWSREDRSCRQPQARRVPLVRVPGPTTVPQGPLTTASSRRTWCLPRRPTRKLHPSALHAVRGPCGMSRPARPRRPHEEDPLEIELDHRVAGWQGRPRARRRWLVLMTSGFHIAGHAARWRVRTGRWLLTAPTRSRGRRAGASGFPRCHRALHRRPSVRRTRAS